MFEDLIKKITSELPLMQFRLMTEMKNDDEQTSVISFIKWESPVAYIVSVINCSDVSIDRFENYIYKRGLEIYDNNRQLINSVICVNILASDDISLVKSFADEKQTETDLSVHNVWWYTNGKELYFGKNQPTKLYGIEKSVKKAIEKDGAADKSIESIHRDAVKKSKLKTVVNIPTATYIFIVLNIIIFAIEGFIGENTAVISFGLNNEFVFRYRQWYRLITYMFLHSGLEHIAMNCISLYIYGSRTEKYCGSRYFAIIYILSGIVGGLLSAACNEGFSVGASGAIFGIIGLMIAICRKTGKQIDGLSYITMITLAIVNIGFGFISPQIDNFGHLGGFVAGAALGIISYRENITN